MESTTILNPPDEIIHCLRCGRKLTNPKCKEVGMGTVCYQKFQKENTHKKLFTIGKNK